MEHYNGSYLSEDGFIQASVSLEDHEVKEFEEGGDRGEKAIMIPAFYNSHTHVGDSIVDEPPKGSIEKIVGPGGLKEEKLSSSTKEELASSISLYLERASYFGVRSLLDFREGGSQGIDPMRTAQGSLDMDLKVGIMARPSKRKYDEEELNKILSKADGLGLSAYRDWDKSQLKMIAEAVKKAGKPLAMHCSEDVREPVEEVLSLGIHHLVHMLEATENDLETCAEEDIPVVICPRANMFFGKMPDIPKMLRSGLDLSLGTDNAMISNSNMFREMETAYRIGMLHGGVSPLDILMMATWNPRKFLKGSCIKDEKDLLLVLEHKEGDPAYRIIKDTSPRDIMDIAAL